MSSVTTTWPLWARAGGSRSATAQKRTKFFGVAFLVMYLQLATRGVVFADPGYSEHRGRTRSADSLLYTIETSILPALVPARGNAAGRPLVAGNIRRSIGREVPREADLRMGRPHAGA